MKTSTQTKNKALSLEYYLGLNYPITFYPEEEGGYTVEIKDLPGCMSQGETLEEALEMIQDAKDLWVTVNMELGKVIPLPSTDDEYSGKFVVRLPVSLHRRLAVAAEREGVSLNTHIVSVLSERISLETVLTEIENLRHLVSTLEDRFSNSSWQFLSTVAPYQKYVVNPQPQYVQPKKAKWIWPEQKAAA
jgi:antitoxin HicB